jgi:hypothetical protein
MRRFDAVPGQVAQLVERSPEKAGVGGSIPSLATILSITYRPSQAQFHSISFQYSWSARKRLRDEYCTRWANWCVGWPHQHTRRCPRAREDVPPYSPKQIQSCLFLQQDRRKTRRALNDENY